ncbi:uncharacterized protein LOC112574659 isoform X2 [Pomacea canaliculata]|uniref:uncharacterized protein LOC112574659 isoform X2 n=1 Tax=Pomacea canaliculata TaxID=400727 RepID=UPI000D72ED50|nr:uncharacterized protein LOC112574659 isoform X2 [Pomacea canaliculata]
MNTRHRRKAPMCQDCALLSTVLHLSYFGGRTPKRGTVPSNEASACSKTILYSLEGRKEKRRFNTLQHLKATIYESILKRYSDVTMAALDKYTREWLAISGDCDGGCKWREENKATKCCRTTSS